MLPRTNSRGTGLLKATSRAPVTLNRHGKTAVVFFFLFFLFFIVKCLFVELTFSLLFFEQHLDRKKRLQEAIIRNKKLKLNESSLSAPSFMQ